MLQDYLPSHQMSHHYFKIIDNGIFSKHLFFISASCGPVCNLRDDDTSWFPWIQVKTNIPKSGGKGQGYSVIVI